MEFLDNPVGNHSIAYMKTKQELHIIIIFILELRKALGSFYILHQNYSSLDYKHKMMKEKGNEIKETDETTED